MNIALINQWYPPESGFGGVAAYNYYFAHAYKKLGHNVFIITGLPAGEKRYREDDGIRVYRIKRPIFPILLNKAILPKSFLRFLADFIYSFYVRKKLLEIDREFKIDIVEYAEINSEGFAHSLFGPKRIPFVIRCHTPYFLLKEYYSKQERKSIDNILIYRMEKFFIKSAKRLTAPSSHLADIIFQRMNIPESRISVVPNAIDTNKFFPGDKPRDSQEIVRLLFVGRIERGKGVLILAKAFLELSKAYNSRLRCIFVGPDRTYSKRKSALQTVSGLFAKEGILKSVEFKGEISDEGLISIYNECDIFVNPSLIYESFSYTCLEAMACGKPVVASRIGGIPEVVEDGETGFLFEPGRIEELIIKLNLLIEDAKKREDMGRKARTRVVEYFDVSKVAAKNLEIYRNLING